MFSLHKKKKNAFLFQVMLGDSRLCPHPAGLVLELPY